MTLRVLVAASCSLAATASESGAQRRPSAMQRVNGPLTVHRALVPLDTVLAIRVLDRRGASLPGARVSWILRNPAEGAHLRVINAVTDSDGVSTAAFTPGRSADPQQVIADVARVGRIDFGVVVPPASVRVLILRAALWSGDSETVSVVLRDSAGAELPGGRMEWTPTDTSVFRVARVDANHARIVAKLAGSADLIAWIGEARGSARVVVRPEVGVRFLTLDSRPPPPLFVEIRSGVLLDSATVRDGAFARRVEGVGDDVEVRAREIAGEPAYQSVAVQVNRGRDIQDLRIALVPRVWRIDAGSYTGTDVVIDAEAAMRRSEGASVFWRLAPISGRGPRRLLGWAEGKLPLHVAFNRAASVAQIASEDSTSFWSVAHELERDLGTTLFVPAEMADSARVEVTPVEIRAQGAEGHTFVTWSDAGDVFDPVVLFRDEATLRNPHVVTHELLHLLGFGHTLWWPSVARPAGGEARLTPQDVAYVQLAMRLRQFQRRTGARPGLPIPRQ